MFTVPVTLGCLEKEAVRMGLGDGLLQEVCFRIIQIMRALPG